MATAKIYPFRPRSNRHLVAGQFWALPLHDGRFACGRVMTVPAFGPKDRIGFVAGFMDWVGTTAPTESDLVGRDVLEQGKTGFQAIANTGGEVLGIRQLGLDGLVAVDPMDHSVGSVHTVWGWRTILNRAEDAFAER